MRVRTAWILGCVLVCCGAADHFANAQTTGLAQLPPTAIGPAERITLTQLQQAVADADSDTAIARFHDLVDQSGRLLTLFEKTGDGEAAFQTYWPLAMYLPDRLLEWTGSDPEVLQAYREIEDPLALDAIRLAFAEGDIALARRNAERYLATSHGDTALVALAQLALERGWHDTARAALLRLGHPWNITGVDPTGLRPPLGLPWHHFTDSAVASPERRAAIAQRLGDPLPVRLPLSPSQMTVDRQEIAARLIGCSILQGQSARAETESQIARAAAAVTGLQETTAEQLFATLKPSMQEATESSDASARPPSFRFLWSTDLPPTPERTDWADPTEVPVARGRQAPVSLPVVAGKRLLAQTQIDIRGYDLGSGRPWPASPQGQPFFDSGYGASEVVFDDQMPIAGWPLFEPTLADDLLFVRQGPEITGWIPSTSTHRASTTAQLVFDLRRDGALLDGYPLSPPRDDSYVWEWEGSPAIVGDLAIASVTARTSAGMVNRLVAWNVATAAVRWMSPVLAIAPALVQDAHVTSTAIPSVRGDLVFHCSSLGSVSAVNIEDGRIAWTTSYPRGELARDRFGTRRRAAFRHCVQPCIAGELVVIAARDCDRILALESETGRLRWATAPGVAADALSLAAGVDQLIASGDALYWLSVRTGEVRAVFPYSPSLAQQAALPAPRAAGFPAVGRDHVYWPTSQSVLVFRRTPVLNSPVPVAVLDLAALGIPSGHLLLADDRLVVVSGQRLAVFAVDSTSSPPRASATN